MSLSARSSFSWSVRLQKSGAESSAQESEAVVVSDLGVLGEGFGWDVFARCGVQLKNSFVRSSLVAREEVLSGPVGATNCSVVEEEWRSRPKAAGGLSLLSSV